MTAATSAQDVSSARKSGERTGADHKGNVLVSWITSTDHKVIGCMYLITSFLYFCIGGVMALIMRAQLFEPGLEIVATREQYNQPTYDASSETVK